MKNRITTTSPVKKLLLEQYLRSGKLTLLQQQLKQELIKQAWADHQSTPLTSSQKHSNTGEIK